MPLCVLCTYMHVTMHLCINELCMYVRMYVAVKDGAYLHSLCLNLTKMRICACMFLPQSVQVMGFRQSIMCYIETYVLLEKNSRNN